MRAALLAAMIGAAATLSACGSSSDDGRVDSSAGSSATADTTGPDDTATTTTDSGSDDVATTPVGSSPASSPASTSSQAANSGGVAATSGSGESNDAGANSGGVSVGGSSPDAGSGGVSLDDQCSSGVLAATIAFGDGAASAGSTTGRIVLRNNGSQACSLSGYPGVSFVGDHGNQLGVPAARDTGAGATTQTLQPGGSASAQIRIVDHGVYDQAECRPAGATGLRIYPPGNTAALFVRYAVQVCQGDERGATVGPVQGG